MKNEKEAKTTLNLLKKINLLEVIKKDGADWPDTIIYNVSDKFLAGLLQSKVNEYYEYHGDDEILLEELISVCKNYLKD